MNSCFVSTEKEMQIGTQIASAKSASHHIWRQAWRHNRYCVRRVDGCIFVDGRS